MLDLNGGTGLVSDALFIAAYALKRSFFTGTRELKRHRIRSNLNKRVPVGRLRIDGESYYG